MDDHGRRCLDSMNGIEVDSAMREIKTLGATLAGEPLPTQEVVHRTKLSRAHDGWEAEARLSCRLVCRGSQRDLEVRRAAVISLPSTKRKKEPVCS